MPGSPSSHAGSAGPGGGTRQRVAERQATEIHQGRPREVETARVLVALVRVRFRASSSQLWRLVTTSVDSGRAMTSAPRSEGCRRCGCSTPSSVQSSFCIRSSRSPTATATHWDCCMQSPAAKVSRVVHVGDGVSQRLRPSTLCCGQLIELHRLTWPCWPPPSVHRAPCSPTPHPLACRDLRASIALSGRNGAASSAPKKLGASAALVFAGVTTTGRQRGRWRS